MEKLYNIKIKDEYVHYFKYSILSKGFCTGLELVIEKDGYCYFKTPDGQYAKIPDAWIDLMLSITEVEQYPYDLCYMGEKVGKIKWPLQFPEYTVEKIFEVK